MCIKFDESVHDNECVKLNDNKWNTEVRHLAFLFNSRIDNSIERNTKCSRFFDNLIKHLCEMKSYEPQFRSKRIFESLKHEITATSLPQHWNDVLHNSSRWETDSVIKHVTDIEISCEKSKLVNLRNLKKGLYRIAFDYWFSYDDHDPRVWCDILNFEVDRKVYFNNIYDSMLTKNENDLIWKIRHGAIPTGRFLYGCKYSDSSNCNYCGELDDLTHIFVTCSRLSGLFQLTQSLIRKLTPTIDKIHVWWYIIGIPASAGIDINVRRLCNWMFAQAKIAMVYSRFNKNRSSGLHCSKLMYYRE